MRKAVLGIGLISMFLVIGTIFISCSGTGSPSGVVRRLHAAVEKENNEEISKLMTADAAGIALKMLSDLQRSYEESGGISKTEQIINGDTAVVTVTYKNGEIDSYDLVKVDGQWKVTIRK